MKAAQASNLNFGKLVSSSFALYRSGFWLFLSLSFINFLVSIFYVYVLNQKSAPIIQFIIICVTIFVAIWIFIALTRVVLKKCSGETISFKEALASGGNGFWRVMGVMMGFLLIMILPMLVFSMMLSQVLISQGLDQIMGGITSQLGPVGTANTSSSIWQSIADVSPLIIIGIIGSFVVICMITLFFFAPTSAIVEDKKTGSFSNSSKLVLKRFWRVLGIILIFMLIFQLIPVLIAVITQNLGEELRASTIFLLKMITNVYSLLATPLVVIFTTLLYFKLK